MCENVCVMNFDAGQRKAFPICNGNSTFPIIIDLRFKSVRNEITSQTFCCRKALFKLHFKQVRTMFLFFNFTNFFNSLDFPVWLVDIMVTVIRRELRLYASGGT